MKRKTKIEIIDETVAFYEMNARSLDGKQCAYRNMEGARCAHSRCLTDEALEDLMECGMNCDRAENVIGRVGDYGHKPEYRGHQARFWNDIQLLHDSAEHWRRDGDGLNILTKEGALYVSNLKIEYAL